MLKKVGNKNGFNKILPLKLNGLQDSSKPHQTTSKQPLQQFISKPSNNPKNSQKEIPKMPNCSAASQIPKLTDLDQ
jgi:hypothetical protein